MNLLTVKQVSEKLACSRSYVWKLLRDNPDFPKPINIGMGDSKTRATRWVDGDISGWLARLSQQSNTEANTNENRQSGGEVHPGAGEEIPA